MVFVMVLAGAAASQWYFATRFYEVDGRGPFINARYDEQREPKCLTITYVKPLAKPVWFLKIERWDTVEWDDIVVYSSYPSQMEDRPRGRPVQVGDRICGYEYPMALYYIPTEKYLMRVGDLPFGAEW